MVLNPNHFNEIECVEKKKQKSRLLLAKIKPLPDSYTSSLLSSKFKSREALMKNERENNKLGAITLMDREMSRGDISRGQSPTKSIVSTDLTS